MPIINNANNATGGRARLPKSQQPSGIASSGNGQIPGPGLTGIGQISGDTWQQVHATGQASPTVQPVGGPTDAPPAEDPYVVAMREEAARVERLRVMNARAIMEAQMTAFGLQGLSGRVIQWVQEGYDAEAIMALVRQTPEYAQRFPAMKALQAKGQSITESEYIAYEKAMGDYEHLYGLPPGMLSSKDQVTKSLTNNVSAREVEERATKASASIYQLPPEYRDQMRNYYGIDSGGLTAYFLDPDVAAPLLEKQFVSAQIGAQGKIQGIDVGRGLAETLQGLGVTAAEARDKMDDASRAMSFTSGKGETATSNDVVLGTFGQQAQQSQIERIAGSRVGAFAGGGSYAKDKTGVSGLGSAAQ